MDIKSLRAECSGWTWRAERYGFGYRYVGTRGQEVVEVFPEAALVGEDDFETRWMVNDGKSRQSYASWWLENRATPARKEPHE